MSNPIDRIHKTNALPAFNRLSRDWQNQILEFLEDNQRETIDSPRGIVDAYLMWNGIQGYTESIIEIVLKAYDK